VESVGAGAGSVRGACSGVFARRDVRGSGGIGSTVRGACAGAKGYSGVLVVVPEAWWWCWKCGNGTGSRARGAASYKSCRFDDLLYSFSL